jgi:hypothetical protein
MQVGKGAMVHGCTPGKHDALKVVGAMLPRPWTDCNREVGRFLATAG